MQLEHHEFLRAGMWHCSLLNIMWGPALRTSPLCVASCTWLQVVIPSTFTRLPLIACWFALAGQISLTLWLLMTFTNNNFGKCMMDCGLWHVLASVERNSNRHSFFVFWYLTFSATQSQDLCRVTPNWRALAVRTDRYVRNESQRPCCCSNLGVKSRFLLPCDCHLNKPDRFALRKQRAFFMSEDTHEEKKDEACDPRTGCERGWGGFWTSCPWHSSWLYRCHLFWPTLIPRDRCRTVIRATD